MHMGGDRKWECTLVNPGLRCKAVLALDGGSKAMRHTDQVPVVLGSKSNPLGGGGASEQRRENDQKGKEP